MTNVGNDMGDYWRLSGIVSGTLEVSAASWDQIVGRDP